MFTYVNKEGNKIWFLLYQFLVIACLLLPHWWEYVRICKQGGATKKVSVVIFLIFCEIKFVYLAVAMCDLVHDVETIFNLCYLLLANNIWISPMNYE